MSCGGIGLVPNVVCNMETSDGLYYYPVRVWRWVFFSLYLTSLKWYIDMVDLPLEGSVGLEIVSLSVCFFLHHKQSICHSGRKLYCATCVGVVKVLSSGLLAVSFTPLLPQGTGLFYPKPDVTFFGGA